MRIFFAGIGGVAIGPLALIARDMGHDVLGSDANESLITQDLTAKGVKCIIDNSDAPLRQAHAELAVDWLVYTAALTDDHPILLAAQELGIHASKRDEMLNKIITEKNLKLIAVAGTHGKTTTTAMIVWLLKKMNYPASYSIGSNISFGPIGSYQAGSEWFVYEADEFDRNFLHFSPYSSLVTSVDYDHPDTYASVEEYKDAFAEFISNSHCTYIWRRDSEYIGALPPGSIHEFDDHLDISKIKLAGEHNRQNAYLAVQCVGDIYPELSEQLLLDAINAFPGTQRRFEKLSDNLYTDYAHHPKEIKSTIQLAKEINTHVAVIYQPHQNVRQHEIKHMYENCFEGSEQVYWLPTYLSRENPNLSVLTPQELISELTDPEIAQPAEMNDDLKQKIKDHLAKGHLVILMSAGDLDSWARSNFN